jgi:hypothetical protein
MKETEEFSEMLSFENARTQWWAVLKVLVKKIK